MSRISLSGNLGGSGTFTVASPNSNSDRTVTLPDASGALVLDGAPATFSTLAVNGNNISAVNSMGFRNRIINGDMRIDQRNAGASVTPAASTYTLDRWRFGCPSARMSVQQNAGGVTPPDGFRNYIGATTTSAYTPAAAEAFTFAQFIEGNNVADLMLGTANARTFTLSFWVRSSLIGTFGAAFSNENGATRSYPFSYAISAANTWEFKTVTVTGDTSGTWGTTAGVGLGVFFSLGAGSDFVGTPGAWTNGDRRTVSGATSVVGTNGATFYITGVQLEAGSVATPFERRDYGRELIMCQRYCQMFSSAEGNGAYLRYAYGECTSSTGMGANVNLLARMRITPALTTSAASTFGIFSGGAVSTASGVSIGADGSSPVVANFGVGVSGGLTAGRAAAVLSNNNNTSFLLFTAEL